MSLRTIVPIAPIRSEASDKSEMVSQLLFGEEAILLDKDQQWYLVKCAHDNYEGWADEKHFIQAEGTPHVRCKVCSPLLLSQNSKTGASLNLSLGAKITDYNSTNNAFTFQGQNWEITHGKVNDSTQVMLMEEMITTAKALVNTPYLWGGRSSAGIDCSGLSQILFQQMGILIPRDASQQVEMGEEVPFIQNIETGDLAFFGDDEASISHVGICLGDGHIIHASGRVRIDPIDQQGIYNPELRKYTHKLRVVKRICP